MEAFLNTILQRDGSRIYGLVACVVEPGTKLFNDLLAGEVQHAYLHGAYQALAAKDAGRSFEVGSRGGMHAVLQCIERAIRKPQFRCEYGEIA